MRELDALRESRGEWKLDELVAHANRLLPLLLPDEADDDRIPKNDDPDDDRATRDNRFRREVNPRLVRHLASIGLVGPGRRRGKEVRFVYEHLVQLLVARRLMAEGHSTSTVHQMTQGQTVESLEVLLLTGSDSAPAAPNRALEFLHRVRGLSESPHPVNQPIPSPPAPPQERWTRILVHPGMELHVRDDYVLPSSPYERDSLLQNILQRLKDAQKRPPR